MKKLLSLLLIASFGITACNLDLMPVTSYHEGNVKVEEDEGSEDESQYTTKEDMEGIIKSIYNSNVKDIQEKGYLDWLVYTECRADNAYCGNPGTSEIVAIESNNQDGENVNVTRDWNWYQNQVNKANQVICNISRIKEIDPTMTQQMHDQWLSEAYCWRAWNLFQMSQIWGDIPLVNTIPPAITSENVEEVYNDYFPARTARVDIYNQVIEELQFAILHAPDVNHNDKSIFTKAFAHGMLARIYAEKTCRDWNKVIEHCNAVEGYGFALVDDYGSMWAYDDTDATRHTSESIFEVPFTKTSGNWVWMMYHRNAYNPDDSFTWIKWITPSRDLIAAYEAEGDTERANASITYDACGWSNYYPAEEYAFMHKCPTNASSIILMRLGEIYLLHAEALAATGDLAGATAYVNKIRTRAGLPNISTPSTQDATIDAVLHERRLELAFEGFRFFDLVRHDRAKAIHDAIPSTDSHWYSRSPLTEETILMPIPQTALDTNPSLVQNAGY